MDSKSHLPLPGSRQSNLKMSFKMGSRSLLTTCSKEEFSKAFATFTNAEQEALHRLFIQVITSLHEDIEAGTILDTVEQIVEEQNLDPLHSDKTDVGDAWRNLSTVKKNEIQHLMGILQMAEEQKRVMRARVDQLKKEIQDVSGAADVSEKMRTSDNN
ncbi:uncharacterized protein LOC130757759 isoform X2 [Actinidia eriantha]|uniref:uncharacterized protein LOC130757759 isoform X2 n=1 Tax=Actinidia eriantha TaxID=165200 RepID=UPI0025873FA8|nr:uncharacterized protein LOC130757759 isoform X2 [Actinidia eriantha]